MLTVGAGSVVLSATDDGRANGRSNITSYMSWIASVTVRERGSLLRCSSACRLSFEESASRWTDKGYNRTGSVK